MGNKVAGNLLIIGGNEDKTGSQVILRRFLELAGGREAKIVVMTTATEYPQEVGDQYREIFTDLGAAEVMTLSIDNRKDAFSPAWLELISQGTGIYFTGGDQLRLTSILGGSKVDQALRQAYKKGIIVAGTSAGASVMSDIMIVEGQAKDTVKKSNLHLAPGLGLLEEVVIDQHFAQRGRLNRLLEAVAQNPFVLGVGLDEDTALLVNDQGMCEVIGSQSVTILDGQSIYHSNISETVPAEALAITNVTMHVLPHGYGYDLKRRLPYTCS